MTESPTVSVVIPAYNAAWCVTKAIDSVLAQDFTELEIIVVDDGSTDETPAVLARYGDVIRILHQENRGLSRARNAGIRAARGELVAFLDADDWWLPAKLSTQIHLMNATPQLGFTSTAARVEDPDGRLVNHWVCPSWRDSFLAHLFRQPAAVAGSGSAVVVRRRLFDRVGLFDESLRSLEDIDMWMRFAAETDYACVPGVLTVILKRPDSMSRNLEIMRETAFRVMRKNRPLLPSRLQGAYWRACVAGLHGDYAKWRYRSGQFGPALIEVLHLLRLAPLARGRLGLGLLRDMVLRRPM